MINYVDKESSTKINTRYNPNSEILIDYDIQLDLIDCANTLANPVGRYPRPGLLRLVMDNQLKS